MQEKQKPESPELNNVAYEKKKEKLKLKSNCFAHPAQDSTNTHPYLYHRERKGHEKKKRGHISEVRNKVRKTGMSLKSKIELKYNSK